MLRVIKRNTEEHDCDKDLEELIMGFINAGYGEKELMRISNKINNNHVPAKN